MVPFETGISVPAVVGEVIFVVRFCTASTRIYTGCYGATLVLLANAISDTKPNVWAFTGGYSNAITIPGARSLFIYAVLA